MSAAWAGRPQRSAYAADRVRSAAVRRCLAVALGAARQRSAPRDHWLAGGGLVLSAASAYAFLVVCAQALGPEPYAPIAALWSLVFLVVIGLFAPLEQEVARAVAARRSRGEGIGPLASAAVRLAVALALILVGATVVASGALTERLLGDPLVTTSAALALAGFAAGHVVKGVDAGEHRLARWAWFLVVDGGVRLALAAALALAGIQTAWPYAIALAVGPWVATVACRSTIASALGDPGPPCPGAELRRRYGLLAVASVGAATLANAGTLLVAVLGSPEERVLVGPFLAALVLARLPLFAFQAVQAALLPRLARLIGTGRRSEALAILARLALVSVVVTAIGVALAAAAGPNLLMLAFGDQFVVGPRTLVLLVLASGAWLLTALLAQGLVADGRHAPVAAAWVGGVLVGALVAAVVPDLLLRAELGMLAGSLAAGVAIVRTLRRASRQAVDPAGERGRPSEGRPREPHSIGTARA